MEGVVVVVWVGIGGGVVCGVWWDCMGWVGYWCCISVGEC